MNSRELSQIFQRVHDRMRDVEGLLPQEAFDELLKMLFLKDWTETENSGISRSSNTRTENGPAEIRTKFSKELIARAPWALSLWRDGNINLSDRTLLDVHLMLDGVNLTELSIDIRSTALRTFVSTDSRKGLGIFLTPENLVRCMVEILSPRESDIICDPACGSGTFLLEAARFLERDKQEKRSITVYGVDKSPRMLLLADLNLGNRPGVSFRRECADSLRELGQENSSPLGLVPNSVDVILTNPPFGVTVTQDTGIPDLFDSGTIGSEQRQSKLPSEVLFVELCLRLLKPEGRLGIVLPRSIMTNESIASRRKTIDELGHLTDIVDLPQETFASTGTQTTTVAAFFQKHPERGIAHRSISIRVARVRNVGFDSTGRSREGNELPGLRKRLLESDAEKQPNISIHTGLKSTESLQSAAKLLVRHSGLWIGKPLGEYVELANTGRTPSRKSYTDEGMFILKVGNLTGRGIDWEPRERNYVSETEGTKRSRNLKLSVQEGDILLTSSAHAARYIGKKVDIVARIPDEVRGVTYVGELLRVRARKGVDPYILLAVLRHPCVRDTLQSAVRGQTAHLHPRDLLEIPVPCDPRSPNRDLAEIAQLLRQEAEIAFELNAVAQRAIRLLESTVAATV